MAVASRQLIQSLDRGLQILEHVAEQGRPVRLSELAQLLGVEKSSVHRLAKTLTDRGYVRQEPGTVGYSLDDKLFSLAGKLASQRKVREHARKYLHILAQHTGETAHLAIRGGSGATLVDYEFGKNPVAVTTQWGSTEPYHCTALGKALLAGMDKVQVRELLGCARLKKYTSNTITHLAELVRQCEQVRHKQFAVDHTEFRKNTNCIASPVYDFRGKVVAAIGISGPAQRLCGRLMEKSARVVKKCAHELSGELGYYSERLE